MRLIFAKKYLSKKILIAISLLCLIIPLCISIFDNFSEKTKINNLIYGAASNYFEDIPREKRALNGTCSEEASLLGNHQKIISYSFLNSDHGYWNGLNEIIQNISTLYPGWFVRIYASGQNISFLKTVVKKRDILFYCDIDNIPPPLNTVRPYPVTMWRFAPLGDPQVDILQSRDSDSPILQREIDAVNEWLKSNKSLHIMRDHPFHGTRILGGMWGLKMTTINKTYIRNLRDKMYKTAYNNKDTRIDQSVLQDILWSALRNDFIAHDSYLCKAYSGSSPWPSQRSPDKRFVGAPDYKYETQTIPSQCPVECRPKNHEDWEYC